MKVDQTIVFNFSFFVDGQNYGFNIPADTKELACSKLANALQVIVSELNVAIKAGTN